MSRDTKVSDLSAGELMEMILFPVYGKQRAAEQADAFFAEKQADPDKLTGPEREMLKYLVGLPVSKIGSLIKNADQIDFLLNGTPQNDSGSKDA